MSKGTWGFSAGTKPDHRVSVSGGLQETKSGGTGKLRLKGRHTNEVKGAAAGAARTGGGCRGHLCRNLVQLWVCLGLWHLRGCMGQRWGKWLTR